MSDNFYINLSLSELNALHRVSSASWVAYIHFKRNIDFATGASTKAYSVYALRSILSRPARAQGSKAEKISIKGVQGIITQLETVGLLRYEREAFTFELPKHDKTPQKNSGSGNQGGNQSSNQTGNQSGNHFKTSGSPINRDFAGSDEKGGNQTGNQTGYQSSNQSGNTNTPINKPSIKPINKLSLQDIPVTPSASSHTKATEREKNNRNNPTESLGGKPPIPPEAVATLPCTPPAPRKRGETQTEVGQQRETTLKPLTLPWFKHQLKQAGVQYAYNAQSEPFYLQWERLHQRGELDQSKFESALSSLLQNSHATPTPKLLDDILSEKAKPQTRRYLMGDMVL